MIPTTPGVVPHRNLSESVSHIRASVTCGVVRWTDFKSSPPLKLLHPDFGPEFASAVISNYGGGMVQNDEVYLRVACDAGARVFIGSQAWNRMYKRDTGECAAQIIEGQIGPEGFCAVLPDVAVLNKDSGFIQKQKWEVSKNAVLFLMDGVVAGRLERCEKFEFTEYTSRIKIFKEGEICLREDIHIHPASMDPQMPGIFSGRHVGINLYLVGTAGENQFETLKEHLETAFQDCRNRPNSLRSDTLLSVASPGPGTLVIRALANDYPGLNFLHKIIGQTLCLSEALGQNPFLRKY